MHSLTVGQSMKFKYNSSCIGRIRYPFPSHIQSVTMIAVGVGVAPMIQTLRALLRNYSHENRRSSMSIVLLYGVRTVRDILMRELLDEWQEKYQDIFKVVYCVGSRWTNVHFGAKTKNTEKSQYRPPQLPDGFSSLVSAELGWVDGQKIQKYCCPPSESTRVIVCGLPGVYDKLCGPRLEPALAEKSVLAELGYTAEMVIKL
mmetsp:Transcript_31212/g.42644  ORF Transcript_31212/g.42644 Transcript_31212/m.42644 type:complete len:202 (+) Transcript_31212:336-941(+)